jgi:hypothetical protein
VLPACLFEHIRYTASILEPYFSSTSQRPVAIWQQHDSDGPEDISTLYRWLRRLRKNLGRFLPFLHEEYMELASAVELGAYQTAVLRTSSEPLDSMALCWLSWWLADQLLTVSGQLLEQTPELSTMSFLNTFCWQKTGRTLLSRPP